MILKNRGKNTSSAEVLQISSHGIWLLVKDTEYFLPFENFPWFGDAKVSQVHKVRLLGKGHLYWPDLDIDLELSSLSNLEKYPLTYMK